MSDEALGFVFNNRVHIFAGDGDFRFNGAPHFYSHLNYLYRTDKKQKWTVSGTENNLAWFSPSEVYSFGESEQRKELHDEALLKLKDTLGVSNPSSQQGYPFVSAFCIYDTNKDAKEPPVGLHLVAEHLFDAFKQTRGVELVCIVSHFDQANSSPHIHGLYVRKADFEYSPFFDVVNVVLVELTD